MALDTTSPLFKVNFTDGSFITVINEGADARKFSTPGQYEEIAPALFIGDFTSGETVIKHDMDGNTWQINNDSVTVGGITYTRGTNRELMYMAYNPDTRKLSGVNVDATIPTMDNVESGSPARTVAVRGIVYMRDTTDTDYDSFGAALSEAERIYVNSPIGGVETSYIINNITGKATNVQMHGVNIYYGEHLSIGSKSFIDLIRSNSTSHSEYHSLTLTNSLAEFNPDIDEIDTSDPFAPGGDSTWDNPGGNGNFTDENDDIDIPGLPSISAVSTGFITLFNPTLNQLRDLSSFMWGSLFDVTTWKKLYADPMDCILGLSIVPVAIPSGTSKEVKVGNLGTGITMTTAAQQYIEVDCGSLNVNEYWGAYLDYSPYTKAEIYLPYIGTHPVDIDDIMGKTVAIKYHVDILSGACTAYIKCGGSVLYEFIGQCSSSIPVSANDFTNVVNGVISIAGAIGSMVASGGAAAPMVAGATTIASAAVNNMKPTVEKSGSMSGTGGMLAVQKPYIILTRPRQALPTSQNSFMGYPAFKTVFLKEVSGYTEVESIHLDNVSGTDEEINEILDLLQKGVIL